MKNPLRLLLISLLVAGVATSCKKLIQSIFPGLDVDLPTISITIPPVPVTSSSELPLGSFSQHLNLDSLIKANTNGAFSLQDISSVKVTKINFKVANPDQQNNISNFETARIMFGSPLSSGTAQVAAVSFPDVYADNFLYNAAEPPELISYFKTNELQYTLFGKLRRITTKPMALSMVITMRVR